MYELVFLSGARAGVRVKIDEGVLLAGRDAECALEVPDPRVSRNHARFLWDGVQLRLLDAASSNGTFVNERPVAEATLDDDDVVRLGSTQLRVRRVPVTSAGQERGGVFGFRDAQEPHTSHAVSVTRLAEETAAIADPEKLRHRLASLVRVAELLARTPSLEALYAPVLDVLFELFPQTDRGFLMLGDSASALEPRAVRQRGRAAAGELKVSRSICRAALQKRAALLYREGADHAVDASHSVADLNIRSAIAVPLSIGDEVLGMVVLDSRSARQAYEQSDLELAAAIGQQVAIAIRNAQLLREVEVQTATRNNLMRFLPEAMADQVLAGAIDAGLGGRRYRGTLLFSDVIGFTGRAERMGPEQLVAFMNRYFNRLVPCIEHESGSIDKFMGDAIMAVWGIPLDDGRSALRAASAGLAMQAQLAALNSELDEPLPMGIGINTGDVVAGNIGAETRREYTVLGDPVNTAQRIGAIACAEQVLIGETTWRELGAAGFGVRMPTLSVKNRVEPVQTYSLRALAMDHGEVALFVPVRSASGPGYMIRRLSDESFILLHRPGPLGELSTRAVEVPTIALGVPQPLADLPPQPSDGGLRRSVVRLADPSLGGLLGPDTPQTQIGWSEMARGDTALDA